MAEWAAPEVGEIFWEIGVHGKCKMFLQHISRFPDIPVCTYEFRELIYIKILHQNSTRTRKHLQFLLQKPCSVIFEQILIICPKFNVIHGSHFRNLDRFQNLPETIHWLTNAFIASFKLFSKCSPFSPGIRRSDWALVREFGNVNWGLRKIGKFCIPEQNFESLRISRR